MFSLPLPEFVVLTYHSVGTFFDWSKGQPREYIVSAIETQFHMGS